MITKKRIQHVRFTIDKKKLVTNLIVPIFALIASLVGIFASFHEFTNKKNNLSSQINETENAIKNLRNLESYLIRTKNDMVITKLAKEKIETEYDKAKELEKLSQGQIEAISVAINKRTKFDIFKDYFLGFVLGVAGSLTASFIYSSLSRNNLKNITEDSR